MKLSTTFITSVLLLAAEQAFATTNPDGTERDRVASCCGAPAQGPDGAPRGWCESIGGHMGCCTDPLGVSTCPAGFPNYLETVYYGNQLSANEPPNYSSTCQTGTDHGVRACVVKGPRPSPKPDPNAPPPEPTKKP
ncbi:hypothetical protein CFE70_004966 [Pyrenophora teres f. teres 0-1]|uniref:Uncharacterized protein n=1 Tax=Pyrenophora teres f. teres TaxID=97479 RepID=A0A6S6W1L2_9PLEO|nr:hypothetical protein HRS9139_05741 [Pyrenophora teres f. teres]KAE8840308.1 hypothetical protein PTNB85_03707 [Pyrenophora teres f. teres]KAE8849551.1 hypothetical protein HRS9122_03567 [Pyrenophora teres f. teres]KAE8854291.1 hypothetical protein PTNB73_10488 [Pyrenophora teres f. teres]KAE8863807.1 hypothetical protein PTNB29_03771 [Pyrenophora teres f. teres]